MLKMHMAGKMNPASYMVRSEGRLVTSFEGTNIASAAGEMFSVAPVGEMYWVFIDTPLFKTTMLVDKHGIGTAPCFCYDMGDMGSYDKELSATAVTLKELDAPVMVKLTIMDSIIEAIADMSVGGFNGSMIFAGIKEEDYPVVMMKINTQIARETAYV